jgi:predicted  nucleic acid-binding Zn-ribbon protein
MRLILPPADKIFSQDESQDKLKMIEDQLRMKGHEFLLDIEVEVLRNTEEKLKNSLNRANKRVKRLKEEIKDLEELLQEQEKKIRTVEALEDEVERLDALSKLLSRRWSDCLIALSLRKSFAR